VTAGTRLGRHGSGSVLSVRQRLRIPDQIGWALLGLVVVAVAVHGFRAVLPVYPRGDLLYHWGLTHAILRGEFPPGGPYEGLPAYYPPGFHLALTLVSRILAVTVEQATVLLSVAWLPVLPLSTFVLARSLTGRDGVALLATALTVFGGGYDVSPDRLWVNSLFLVGHEAYPLYPRDIVFGLLPLAVYAFVRALGGARPWGWAILAGLLLGICAIVQIQLLLPVPFCLATVAAAVWIRRPGLRARAIATYATTGVVGFIVVAPWLLQVVDVIRRNGGVALDSAETLLPLRIGFWDLARQFGLLLPFALAGCGVVLAALRETDNHLRDLRPRLREAPLVLVVWFAVPFVLALLYDPRWPLEDALRPQRLWLLSSQPGAILAAIGLVVTVEQVVGGRWGRPRIVAPVLAAAFLAAALPTTVFTARLLSTTWIEPEYAHLRLVRDRVPDFAAMLGTSGPRDTVLTYEDWSSLAWYETGSWVVAVKPPGYAKLGFDPGRFTHHSQTQRRTDVARAFDGYPSSLGAVAAEYDAHRILLARRGETWGLVHQVAATAAELGRSATGPYRIIDGNGWDAVELDAGGGVAFAIGPPDDPADLEIRFLGTERGRTIPDRHFRLLAIRPSGAPRLLAESVVPATSVEEWQIVMARVELGPGERLEVEAVDPVTVQSVLGFVRPDGPPSGWHVALETPDAVMLEPDE
jgi:hypothetical protein